MRGQQINNLLWVNYPGIPTHILVFGSTNTFSGPIWSTAYRIQYMYMHNMHNMHNIHIMILYVYIYIYTSPWSGLLINDFFLYALLLVVYVLASPKQLKRADETFHRSVPDTSRWTNISCRSKLRRRFQSAESAAMHGEFLPAWWQIIDLAWGRFRIFMWPDCYLWNPTFVAFEVPVGRFSASLVGVCHSRNHVSISCCILQSSLVQAGCAPQQCPVSTPWLHEYCRWGIPAGLLGIAMSTLEPLQG